ncbi:MAG: TIGR03617 family F420-dependent LLM class oxidoreductase [Deltaproteobacteria bacterium]|nr:TIGR03617 family F420-dependent LLM class oxidoreductase [Deltaproteobacteria bacterium]MBW2446127.1 TIGR03617 family F420-dependent LLM class oxidoreductase [Deltaproteobacteria bacterium]
MRVNASLISGLESVPSRIRAIEAAGYDGAFSAEISSDPFLPLLLAAEHSERVRLMTAISVAFARNPMTVAGLAHDLNQYSGGRFHLGLGSQIEPHIRKRFSMPWSKPAARMREFVLALQAIWSCWLDGTPLDFRGEFYQHTLMTPMFTPARRDFERPAVHVAAVGPRMTEVAGEVADGLIVHGFTTEKYLREVTLPAVERGLARAGRARADFDISAPVIAISGMDDEAVEKGRQLVKMQLAFYASTPAYKPVLDLHGWGELQPTLNRLSKQGGWQEMGELISEEILEAFAVVCEDPADLAHGFAERFGGLIDTWQCTVDLPDPDAQGELLRSVREL